jgi:hypothetical protein
MYASPMINIPGALISFAFGLPSSVLLIEKALQKCICSVFSMYLQK